MIAPQHFVNNSYNPPIVILCMTYTCLSPVLSCEHLEHRDHILLVSRCTCLIQKPTHRTGPPKIFSKYIIIKLLDGIQCSHYKE